MRAKILGEPSKSVKSTLSDGKFMTLSLMEMKISPSLTIPKMTASEFTSRPENEERVN
jgi:hypothetical protein